MKSTDIEVTVSFGSPKPWKFLTNAVANVVDDCGGNGAAIRRPVKRAKRMPNGLRKVFKNGKFEIVPSPIKKTGKLPN